MIFPNVSLKDWLEKYPDLKTKSVKCSCGVTLHTSMPFISKNYIGITTAPCLCGNNQVGADSIVTRTGKEASNWEWILGYF